MSKRPTSETFRTLLSDSFAQANRAGARYIDIKSKDLHETVGGYPGTGHRMPVCCAAMHALRASGDEVLAGPPSGQGATLVIRYKLPRP